MAAWKKECSCLGDLIEALIEGFLLGASLNNKDCSLSGQNRLGSLSFEVTHMEALKNIVQG